MILVFGELSAAGDKIYERVKDELGPAPIGSTATSRCYITAIRDEFYRQLHTVIHKEYRSRKTFRRLARLRPWRSGDVRQVGAMVYHSVTLPMARRKLKGLEGQSAYR